MGFWVRGVVVFGLSASGVGGKAFLFFCDVVLVCQSSSIIETVTCTISRLVKQKQCVCAVLLLM